MATPANPDIIVYLCKNCIPGGKYAPAQWNEAGLHVRIKEIPCSGKIDAQYILHALEGGLRGVCVVTCPQGDCTFMQGNYRAEMRLSTVRRLLEEIGPTPVALNFCIARPMIPSNIYGVLFLRRSGVYPVSSVIHESSLRNRKVAL